MVRSQAFGLLLKRYRQAVGLTQEALAERAGYSTVYVSMLERGRRMPLPATGQHLAAALALAPRDRAALLALVPRPQSPAAGSQPLVGRAHELALLERHLAGDGPPVLLLAGEPGIGKTRLLHEAAARAGGAGLRVLEGGCQRRGGQEPYAPVLDALKRHIHDQPPPQRRADLQGCAWLVRLLPELAEGPIEPLPTWTLPPEQERRLMVEAVVRYLANVAGPAGTLLILDDLHWAGADGLDLLATLARAAAEASLRVVGAYRDTEVHAQDALSGALADLAHAELATHLRLGPLAPPEAAQLLDGLLEGVGGVEDALRQRLLQRAGGLPFFLVSCARALGTGTLPRGDGDDVPWDLAQTIRQRTATLPPAARDVLDVAAVAGRVAPRPLLVDVVARPEEEVLAALDTVCAARLLEEDGPQSYRFLHDLVREVVERDLGAARRAALHRRIGEALERGAGEPAVEALAYHYARSDVHDRAVLYLEQAGDHAHALAAHVAAQGYYRELVDRLEGRGRDTEAAHAREKLGLVLTTVAHYDAALAVLEQAAATYRVAGDAEGVRRTMAQIGRVHAFRGTPEEGVQRLQPLLAGPEHEQPSHGLAALYAVLARLLFLSGRYGEQLVAAERGADLARAIGDDCILAEAEGRRGAALGMLGRVEESLGVLDTVIALAERAGDLDSLCHALNNVGATLLERGQFDPARRQFERALEVAERLGDPVQVAFMTCACGETAFYSGDWPRARLYLERAVAASHHVGASWGWAYPLLELGRLCLAEGAWEIATRCLEESIRTTNELQAQRDVHTLLAELDVLQGRPARAPARLAPLLDRPGEQEWDVTQFLPVLAWAHLEVGDVVTAHEVAAQAVRRARAANYRLAWVDALRVHAMVLARQGRYAEARCSVQEGLSLARSMPYPYAEARLLHVDGAMHAQKDEMAAAHQRLEAALSIFRRLGARKEAERVEHACVGLQRPAGRAASKSPD